MLLFGTDFVFDSPGQTGRGLDWNGQRRMSFTQVFGTVPVLLRPQHPNCAARAESVYRSFQRFFADCVLLALSPKPANGWVLVMDLTHWKFGKTHINILVITVIFNGGGRLIAWQMLPKKSKCGNSRRIHRIRLIQEVFSILPISEIRVLTMDRKFIGGKWLAWLRLMEVSYVVRVKENTLVGGHPDFWWCKRKRWEKKAAQLHEVFGERVYFAAKRIRKGQDAFWRSSAMVFQARRRWISIE